MIRRATKFVIMDKNSLLFHNGNGNMVEFQYAVHYDSKGSANTELLTFDEKENYDIIEVRVEYDIRKSFDY